MCVCVCVCVCMCIEHRTCARASISSLLFVCTCPTLWQLQALTQREGGREGKQRKEKKKKARDGNVENTFSPFEACACACVFVCARPQACPGPALVSFFCFFSFCLCQRLALLRSAVFRKAMMTTIKLKQAA